MPPGWNSWKSAGENPLRSNSAIASASPSAIIIVVEVVGARPIGQASAAPGSSSTTSAACASVEFAAGGDRDQRDLEAARIRDDVGQFAALAGIGQSEDRVLGADHAEVAVAGFRRMDELRRLAGRGQRRGDLARDMAALADPGHDQPAARRRAQIEGAPERAVERARQPFEPGDLGAQHAPADIEVASQRRPASVAFAGAASYR